MRTADLEGSDYIEKNHFHEDDTYKFDFMKNIEENETAVLNENWMLEDKILRITMKSGNVVDAEFTPIEEIGNKGYSASIWNHEM